MTPLEQIKRHIADIKAEIETISAEISEAKKEERGKLVTDKRALQQEIKKLKKQQKMSSTLPHQQ